MDIYMDGMTGVEAVRKIREMDETIPIAFTTTSTEHTLESYRLSVLKYLEKPVRQKDINDLLHLVKLQRDSVPRLTVRQGGETQKIPLSELFYLEQKAHHVFLYRRDGGTLQLYGKLSDLLPQLEGQPFFCPHKSYCVNLAFVRGSTRNTRVMTWWTGKSPISRSNRPRPSGPMRTFCLHGQGGRNDGAVILYFLYHAAQPQHPLCPVLELPLAVPQAGSGAGDGQCAVQIWWAAAYFLANGLYFRNLELAFAVWGF